MKGILLISHGPLAQAMLDTAAIFFGPSIPQIEALGLQADQAPEDFRQQIKEAVDRLDSGEGVLILADLYGGTPANQTAFLLDAPIQVITGMNLPLVMEVLGSRQNPDSAAAMQSAREQILDYTEKLAAIKAGRKRK